MQAAAAALNELDSCDWSVRQSLRQLSWMIIPAMLIAANCSTSCYQIMPCQLAAVAAC